MRALVRPVALLLTLGMVGMWLATSVLAYLILGLAPLAALLIGAILAPTDPVVASAIVTGRFAQNHLPDRVRSTLSLESGANDGLGYLFVLLPVLLLQQGAPQAGDGGAGQAVHVWLVDVVGVGVLLAIGIGLVLGALTGLALRVLDRRGIVEEHSLLSLSVALSLLAVTGAKLAGSDGILAAFTAGLGFNLTIDRRQEQAEENIQEAIAKLFNLPIFVLLGLALPVADWRAFGPSALLFAGAVLLLRRPPVLLLLGPLLGGRLERRDVAFLGWFGPIGVAALYYSLLAVRETDLTSAWPLASMVITTSVVVHGITAAPLTRRYARIEAQAGGAHQ
jgi:NhaP-type Na+/H+ or K+/H+ antiporter